MCFLKNYLNKLYINYVFKYYYILYQKTNWRIRKKIIKPILELTKISYKRFDPKKELFSSIQIETQTYCNLNCQFCPNNKINREHGIMSLEIFNKIVNELSKLNFNGDILLYLENEPLLDKRILELIEIAHKKCPHAKIKLYSNGVFLTNELLCNLFDAGLSFLRLNDYTMVQANKPKKKEFYEIDSKLKTFNYYLKNKKKVKIYKYFPQINKLSNRSGLMEGVGIPTPLNLFCNRPFEEMYINFKGEAIFCCNDWLYEERMGNISNNSLAKIWANKKYALLREQLQRNNRIKICYECDYTSVLFPKRVLKRLLH